MLQSEIVSQLERCAYEIDKLFTEKEIEKFDGMIKEISECLKKELHWFTMEAPGIAKEKGYSLDDNSAKPHVPEGYVADHFGEDFFELYKKGKDNKPDMLVGRYSDISRTI